MIEWRKIADGVYEVSDDGCVRRVVAGKGARAGWPIKQSIATTGYPVVSICIGGKRKVIHIHALVAEAFIGPRPHGLMVNHKDGDKANNHLGNLEYVTRAENTRHAYQLGLIPRQKGASR